MYMTEENKRWKDGRNPMYCMVEAFGPLSDLVYAATESVIWQVIAPYPVGWMPDAAHYFFMKEF
jgi:hypothetical protein